MDDKKRLKDLLYVNICYTVFKMQSYSTPTNDNYMYYSSDHVSSGISPCCLIL